MGHRHRPGQFGKFGGDLLVGNFSYAHSEINAFDPKTLKFEGDIKIHPGVGHTAGGLWTLTFGTEADNGGPNTLYFTDGIDGETNGLFGAIMPSDTRILRPGMGLVARRRRRSSSAIGEASRRQKRSAQG